MMGRYNLDQSQLFYSFDLDAVIPGNHLVREIAAVLDLSWVHGELASYYPAIGRPPVDPVLMIRRFCGLSIEDKLPDHSAFSRARNERFHDSDIFRRVFERVVAACIAADLVGGRGFAVDASQIAADANKHRKGVP